jgi:hypothetical protein
MAAMKYKNLKEGRAPLISMLFGMHAVLGSTGTTCNEDIIPPCTGTDRQTDRQADGKRFFVDGIP